jgi:heterodisulfide reductase subunit C
MRFAIPYAKTHVASGYYDTGRRLREYDRAMRECFDCITGTGACPRGRARCEERELGRRYMKFLRKRNNS